MAERALCIAVDGRELLGHPTGVGRYLSEVLDAWHADPTWPHQLTIVVPAPPPADLIARYRRTTWSVTGGTAGTWWEQTRLPRAVRQLAADVLFAPAYTGPIRPPCPMVLTIHDLSYFAHREWFGWREGVRRRWVTHAAARRATAILTVSEFAGADVVARLSVPASRVYVVKHGAPVEAASTADSQSPVVLYVGSLFERRHLPDLVAGFARLAATRADARLVVVGQDRSRHGIDPRRLAVRHGVASQVEWHRYLPEHALIAQYARARAFAFLSDYEGFGMTPLEAMAFGVPPIVLDTPVAREIYGDAAVLVPADPEAIADALVAVIEDGPVRADLVARGRRRLGLFSWARSAQAIRCVIEEAAGG
jgi:glycosyltransferase involved in cell wall biosynthesis